MLYSILSDNDLVFCYMSNYMYLKKYKSLKDSISTSIKNSILVYMFL